MWPEQGVLSQSPKQSMEDVGSQSSLKWLDGRGAFRVVFFSVPADHWLVN